MVVVRARSRRDPEPPPKASVVMTVVVESTTSDPLDQHRATTTSTSAPTVLARRNALVEEAIPLAKLIVSTYCRDHGIFGLREEIEAEALAGLLNLADTYRPESPWLKYVNRNLKFRLIDAMRRRSGRPSGKNFERRSNINDADVLDLRLEAIGAGDPAFAEVEAADAFEYATQRMPERTRWIISQRMAGVKMDEIGATLGISESRVSQILFEIRPELERVLVGQ
jgi:RNA polymerase sigma factor (sigma-70 family)